MKTLAQNRAAPTGAGTFTPYTDLTVTNAGVQVRIQNLSRVALLLKNHHASVHVRLGDVTTKPTATRGIRLGAGESITITSTAEIWAISEGADVTVSVTEES